jgi:hypothetical protein
VKPIADHRPTQHSASPNEICTTEAQRHSADRRPTQQSASPASPPARTRIPRGIAPPSAVHLRQITEASSSPPGLPHRFHVETPPQRRRLKPKNGKESLPSPNDVRHPRFGVSGPRDALKGGHRTRGSWAEARLFSGSIPEPFPRGNAAWRWRLKPKNGKDNSAAVCRHAATRTPALRLCHWPRGDARACAFLLESPAFLSYLWHQFR